MGATRVSAGQDSDHIVVGTAAKRKRPEFHLQTKRAELSGDVISGRAVALRCGGRMAHAFERGHLTAQPLDELGKLTGG